MQELTTKNSQENIEPVSAKDYLVASNTAYKILEDNCKAIIDNELRKVLMRITVKNKQNSPNLMLRAQTLYNLWQTVFTLKQKYQQDYQQQLNQIRCIHECQKQQQDQFLITQSNKFNENKSNTTKLHLLPQQKEQLFQELQQMNMIDKNSEEILSKICYRHNLNEDQSTIILQPSLTLEKTFYPTYKNVPSTNISNSTVQVKKKNQYKKDKTNHTKNNSSWLQQYKEQKEAYNQILKNIKQMLSDQLLKDYY